MNLTKLFYLIVITIIGSTLYYISKDDTASISNDNSESPLNKAPSSTKIIQNTQTPINELETKADITLKTQLQTKTSTPIEKSITKELTKEEKIAQNIQKMKEKKLARKLKNEKMLEEREIKQEEFLTGLYDIGFEQGHIFSQDELKALYIKEEFSEFHNFKDVQHEIYMDYEWLEYGLKISFEYNDRSFEVIRHTQPQTPNSTLISEGDEFELDNNDINSTHYHSDIYYDGHSWFIEKHKTINELINGYEPIFSFKDNTLKNCILDSLNLPKNSTPTRDQMLSLLVVTCDNISDISGLETWQHLKGIDLSINRTINFEKLKNIHSLKLVKLRGINTSIDLNHIESLTQIKILALENITLQNIEKITKLAQLKQLNLINNLLNDLDFIHSLHALTDLIVINNPLDEAKQHFKLPPNLNNIDLINMNLQSLSMFQHSENILTITANHNNLNNLNDIKHLSKLIDIEVSNNQLTDVSALTELQNLDYIILNHNQISTLPNLKNLYALKLLRIIGNNEFDCKSLSQLTYEVTEIAC